MNVFVSDYMCTYTFAYTNTSIMIYRGRKCERNSARVRERAPDRVYEARVREPMQMIEGETVRTG